MAIVAQENAESTQEIENLEQLGITLEWVKTNAPDLAQRLPDNEALAKKLFIGKASKEFYAQYKNTLQEIRERFATMNTLSEEPESTAEPIVEEQEKSEESPNDILEGIVQAAMNIPIDLKAIEVNIPIAHRVRFLTAVFNGFDIPIVDGKVKPMDIYNRLT